MVKPRRCETPTGEKRYAIKVVPEKANMLSHGDLRRPGLLNW